VRLRISTCILILLAAYGLTARQRPRVTGFFSDMHYIPGAGDVLGTEVWIVYARDRYYATVQLAEGEPDAPVVVPVEVSGSKVKFTVTEHAVNQDGRPAPDFAINFDGTVTRAGLSGTVNSQRLNLKRRSSYWQ
jgi:hypothetical protein